MKIASPPPDDDDDANNGEDEDTTSNKDEGEQPSDALHDAQQKHRRAEREAIRKAIADHFSVPKPDAANLERIRSRWDIGVLNQLHQGKWHSLWPVLDAARMVPGLCSKGLVIFGGWFASRPQGLSGAVPPPEDLLGLVTSYGFHSETLDLIARFNASRTVDEYQTCDAEFKKWVGDHRKEFGFYASHSDDINGIEGVAKACVNDFPPLIKTTLVNLENRVFLFLPDEHDPASGWGDFFTFADAYKRLPADIVNGFGDYFLIIQKPSS